MTISYSPSAKGFFTSEWVYPNLPNDLIPISNDDHQRLLYEINSNNKVIIVSNGEIILEEKPPYIPTWDIIRLRRNKLLETSDHTQLPDFPEAKKAEWATYRQALRDIPQTYATPEEVIWPTPPT
jgi:hypothetical protein